jgi:RHS repeat-associated protein
VTNRRYTLRPEYYGELISEDSPVFHHFDALGSTMQLTDANQDLDTAYLYRAFGERTVLSGTNPSRFNWLGRWGYYRQPDTGDYWVRANIQRPGLGRWLKKDPLFGVNRWAYALNMPLSFADPSGMQALPQEVGQQGPNLVLLVGGATATGLGLFLAPQITVPILAGALLLGVATPTAGPEIDPGPAAGPQAGPQGAPQPCPKDRDDDRGGCRQKHPNWPWCKYTNKPEVASGKPPQGGRPGMGRPKPDPVNRVTQQPDGPGQFKRTVKRPGSCFGNDGAITATAEDYVMKQAFRGPGAQSWAFTVRCCPCCRKGSDTSDKQCWNVHRSG